MMRKGTFALALAVPLGLAACAGGETEGTTAAAAATTAAPSGTATNMPGLVRAPAATVPSDARSRQILALDVDGNGMIDRNEWLNGRQAAFVLIDYDNDGMVDQSEYLAATRAMHGADSTGDASVMGSTGGTGSMGMGGTGMGGTGMAGERGEVVATIDRPVQAPLGVDPGLNRRLGIFATLDRNRDGLLAQEEFVLGADQFFETMDASGDNLLQMDELNRHAAGSNMQMAR
jgi:EF hand